MSAGRSTAADQVQRDRLKNATVKLSDTPHEQTVLDCFGSISELPTSFRAMLRCGTDCRWRGGRI